jgi:oligopeptide/dipeptide ABC transporter ATP-binding protein
MNSDRQTTILETKALTKIFTSRSGWIRRQARHVYALDSVDLAIEEQETLGVVGESGCGKTTLGRTIMWLTPPTSGQVIFDGQDTAKSDKQTVKRLFREMQMVFQNPYTSFDPRFTVFKCVAEPLKTHTDLRGEALEDKVRELLNQVGMPGDITYRYAHEFSGGQLQRIAIARALATNPRFIVLDEPTSALDVSVQAQIINLLQVLQRELKLTYLFISHDLSVVQHISNRVAVMYLGKVVELNHAQAIFDGRARHPYTQALLSAMPTVTKEYRKERIILEGNVPNAADPPSGCHFHPRCPVALPICSQVEPKLDDSGAGHPVACHLVNNELSTGGQPAN